jgi:HAD superfamily 5'-nucleotidase-like hydrolase
VGPVYVNRTLNLKKIDYIGLDMDHTLIRYNGRNFEALAHRIMLEKLVADLNYPASVLKLKFEYDRAIRGLVIDKVQGNVLKLNRHGAIRVSFHGLKAIEYVAQKSLYKSRYIDLGDPEFDTVDTTFSIAFAGLFAQLVELKDTTESSTLPTYDKLAVDLTRVLDRAHRDGSLKDVVAKNLSDYIIKDPEVVRGLERFKRHGKKIFILTNSDYFYCKLLLDYAINPFLKDHKSWTDVFEFVITLAQKPRFFIDSLPFLRINPTDGTMTNVDGKLPPGIYQGGCASTFTDRIGVAPDEILYIGDHIYGDIVRLKKDCAWRTALVVEELKEEIDNLHQAKPTTDQINHLMAQKIPLEIKLDDVISEKIEKGVDTDAEISKLLHQIGEIDHRIAPLIQSQQRLFNPYWGEVMRVGIEESYFAYQVERYACIYMSKLSDLFSMSPRTYFRSFKRPLAHELE